MNKKYWKWLHEVKEDGFAQEYPDWFWGWVKSGQFKPIFLKGETPGMAAFSLVPW